MLKHIFSALLLVLMATEGFATRPVLVFRDFSHKGDEGQIKGVLRALESQEDITVEEFNLDQGEALQNRLQNIQATTQPFVLSVGEKTVVPFSQMLPFKGATSLHMAHMVTKDHPALIGKVDYLAVPVHASASLKAQLLNSTTGLIETVGVSHNRQVSESQKAYAEYIKTHSAHDRYLGIMLAGDAPTPEGEMKFFTEGYARQLARYVASIREDRHILLTNGPRTGKHNPRTKEEIKTVHREGQSDAVTTAFLDELKNQNVSPKDITVFDFQFGSPVPSMDIILGALHGTKSPFLVPGESTSAISESIDTLPQGSVMVYVNTAMNAVHQAHVMSELNAGRVRHPAEGFEDISTSKASAGVPSPSAAETIAKALLQQK